MEIFTDGTTANEKDKLLTVSSIVSMKTGGLVSSFVFSRSGDSESLSSRLISETKDMV